MKLLSMDTSGATCTVAVTDGFALRARMTVQNKKTHSQTLLPMIEAALTQGGVSKEELDAIAVSEGPGSFTGLRIAAACAKALALALDIPVVGVPTPAALAANASGCSDLVCPMMDARRSQVYAGLYEMDENAIPVPVLAASPVDVNELTETINEKQRPVLFLGDGVSVYEAQLTKGLTVPFRRTPLQGALQDGASVAFLAAALLEGSEEMKKAAAAAGVHVCDADAFSPVYLRPAQAEREAVLLRPMEARDAESAYALECASFTRPWTKQMLADVVSDKDSIAIVAVVNEREGALTDAHRVIGTCFVKNIADEGTVTNVNVDRDFRRQGIAEAMLTQLIAEGREAGIRAFTLEVRKHNDAARKLYEKCGFVFEGERPGFYEEPREDAAIYWLRND